MEIEVVYKSVGIDRDGFENMIDKVAKGWSVDFVENEMIAIWNPGDDNSIIVKDVRWAEAGVCLDEYKRKR